MWVKSVVLLGTSWGAPWELEVNPLGTRWEYIGNTFPPPKTLKKTIGPSGIYFKPSHWSHWSHKNYGPRTVYYHYIYIYCNLLLWAGYIGYKSIIRARDVGYSEAILGISSLHDTTSHWLHGNSSPKFGCHYFWPRLIALPRNTLPILLLFTSPRKKVLWEVFKKLHFGI
jgi:hypothetical protein